MPKPYKPDESDAPVLPDSAYVVRALRSSRWIDPVTNDLLPDVYVPRENGKDDDGLSVVAAESDSEEALQKAAAAASKHLTKSHGSVKLKVGDVRAVDTRLDVVPTPSKNSPFHSSLTGIPKRSHDHANAERLAGQLVRISQIVDHTIRKNGTPQQ